MERTKPPVKALPAQEMMQVPISPNPSLPKVRRRQTVIPAPRTKEGGVDWAKHIPTILTSRPEGMTQEQYKDHLKQQKKRLKQGLR